MSWLARLKRRVAGAPQGPAGKPTEGDVPVDSATSRSRAVGGVDDPGAVARNSTTGTTPNGSFVGRAGGDETDVGKLGGEVRAESEQRQERSE